MVYVSLRDDNPRALVCICEKCDVKHCNTNKRCNQMKIKIAININGTHLIFSSSRRESFEVHCSK